MRILGIDPGSTRIGFGVVDAAGNSLNMIDYGVIEIFEKDRQKKLQVLKKEMGILLKKFNPEVAGVEKLFFLKNKKTANEVSESRGVIMLSLIESGVKTFEYSPMEIKASVTGYGGSDKQAVLKMVKKILKIKDFEGHDDASDALAVAITVSNFSRINFST